MTLTYVGSEPVSLTPCPTYTEDLLVDGRALKPPGPERLLLNCSAIADALAPGASVTLQMHYAIPVALAAGPAELVWSIDPGSSLDQVIERAALAIVPPA